MSDATEQTPEQPSVKQAWSDVGEGFSSLGRLMRERYRAAGGEGGEGGEARDASTEEAAVRRAFEQVTAAVKQLGDRVADVAKDDDVKAQARTTAGSLDTALSTTVDMIVDQVNELLGRAKGSDEAEAPSSAASPEPAAEDRPGDDRPT